MLAELCGEYGERLRAAGWRAPETKLAGQLEPSERPLSDPLLSAGSKRGRPVSASENVPAVAAETFASWLRKPAPQGAAAGLNRYLYAVYERRPELQSAFPRLDEDADGLIAWAWEQGSEELGLAQDLLLVTGGGPGATGDAGLTVNVFGYLRDTLGIAEAARLYITALEAVGVPITTTAVAPDLPVDLRQGKTLTRFGQRSYEEVQAPFDPAFNLVCLNGDQLAAFVRAGGDELLGDRITIGVWGWETDVCSRRAGDQGSSTWTRSGCTQVSSPRTSRGCPLCRSWWCRRQSMFRTQGVSTQT